MQRRQLLQAIAMACAPLPMGATQAQSRAYPTAPIRLLVPYPAGGGSDFLARLLAPSMGATLGQTVYIENRPGGGGVVGATAVARTLPADGYTVLLSDANPLVVTNYDPLPDLEPVTLAGRYQYLLAVNPAVLDVRTVAEVVAASRRAPTGIDYASPGPGTTHHLSMELFARDANVKVTSIPYKGGAPALQDLLAGRVAMMMLDWAMARQYVEAGKLRAIAATGRQRIAAIPDVPTMAEQGVAGYEVEGWLGLSVRKGTPREAVMALRAAYQAAVQQEAVAPRMAEAGITAGGNSPEAFAQYRDGYMTKWRKLIQDRGLKPD